jgi:hypothetical protein
MVQGFGRRLGVATAASTCLFIATWGSWRVAQLAGLTKDPWKETGREGPDDLRPLVTIGALAGIVTGGGYALMRPMLPGQPELAGLLYAFASALALRVPVNAVASRVGRERRMVTRSDLVGMAVLGLALAEAERLFR